jgi:hypothetical protein
LLRLGPATIMQRELSFSHGGTVFDPILAHLAEEGMVFVVGVIAVIGASAVAVARSSARRHAAPDDSNRRLDEIAARLSHLQMTVDASAVEIERISEGQRFTTKLLAERAVPDRAGKS